MRDLVTPRTRFVSLLFGVIAVLAGHVRAADPTGVATPQMPFHWWATTPPMGWNSWDCFATTVTEAQTKAQADVMAEKLARFGWQYITVDIQWYEPAATGFNYRKGAELAMDEWGRLVPATNRFPSAANGAGFKALADYVHAKGLKFGIHLMRGIPRQAVARNTPVLGTTVRAADIANTKSVCTWNTDMYGVDMSKPGAQEYYDSVFALIASWGVDLVKVDDISRPYHDNEKEIEAVRRAIDRAGRPMVLSLSPGETALDAAQHVMRHANMWRISDDFWDNWPALHEQFARLQNWNAFRGPGYWPDADMLPFGVLDMGRRTTHFTQDEQRTVMTLWSIARSPLIFGGDMTKLDEFTLSLLTNADVIAANQKSSGNRPLFDRDGLIAWIADVPESGGEKYLALFNARDRLPLNADKATWRSEIVTRKTPGQGVAVDVDLAGASTLVLVADGAGDGSGWDHALWVEPRLVDSNGKETPLTDLAWANASAGYGEVSKEKSPSGTAMSVAGKPIAHGIAAHARSTIEYRLPAGTARFRAFAAIDDGALTQPQGATVRFLVFAIAPGVATDAAGIEIPVNLDELGIGACGVKDLWSGGSYRGLVSRLAPFVPWHGAALFRLSPLKKTETK